MSAAMQSPPQSFDKRHSSSTPSPPRPRSHRPGSAIWSQLSHPTTAATDHGRYRLGFDNQPKSRSSFINIPSSTTIDLKDGLLVGKGRKVRTNPSRVEFCEWLNDNQLFIYFLKNSHLPCLSSLSLLINLLDLAIITKAKASMDETAKDFTTRLDTREWVYLFLYGLVPGIGASLPSGTSIQVGQRDKTGKGQGNRVQS